MLANMLSLYLFIHYIHSALPTTYSTSSCGFRGRAGHPLIRRSVVWLLAPPVLQSTCPWARYLNANCCWWLSRQCVWKDSFFGWVSTLCQTCHLVVIIIESEKVYNVASSLSVGVCWGCEAFTFLASVLHVESDSTGWTVESPLHYFSLFIIHLVSLIWSWTYRYSRFLFVFSLVQRGFTPLRAVWFHALDWFSLWSSRVAERKLC